MSGTALRRSTNKQGLHNLLRLTAQRSMEDAEETQRERRRRAREAARAHAGGTGSWGALRDSVPQTQNNSSPSDSTVPQSVPQCDNSAPKSLPQCENSVPQSVPQCENSVPQSVPKCENSVPQSVPQCDNSAPKSLPQCENSVPQSVPQCENSVPQSVPQCENSVPQSVPKCENSVPQSVPKCENSVPQSVPKCENSVPQSVPKCENSVPASKDSTPQSEDRAPPSKDRALDASLKPGRQATLEEDEGFSDWTLKFGGTHQHRPEEQSPERASSVDGSLSFPTHPTSRWHEEEQENRGGSETKDSERSGEPQRSIREVGEEERMDTPKKEEKGEEKQSKVTYVSSIFLPQERRRTITNGAAAGEEVTSCTITTKRAQRVVEEVRVDTTEVEVKMEKRQEQERFWRRQLEAEVALEELRKRREEQRRAREEDKRKREEEEHLRQVQEEESIRQMRAAIERRRIEAEKMKRLSITEGEPFSPVSPKSPTFKNETEERVTAENTSSIVERTESLNRSLKKNNGVKTLPPVLVSTIDIRLKQYTHALETSCREGRQTVTDIPRSPEPVASKKSLFEDGDAWSQSSARNLQLKDTDGLKVAVADRISHWVKGNPESCSRKPPLKPSIPETSESVALFGFQRRLPDPNVKAGDVQSKKSLWESVRASCSEGSAGKGSFCGNRYRFVVTGHGKYEKMAVSDDENE